MGHGALKLHRAAKSRLSSRAAGIFLVLGPAWRRNPVFLLVVHDPSCLLAGILGCFRGIPHHPWCLEQLLWEGRFGLGTPGGSVGASNTLAWALSSLWSLFPNCSFLRKDTMRWWDEFCLPGAFAVGQRHWSVHPPTKFQCVPSRNHRVTEWLSWKAP